MGSDTCERECISTARECSMKNEVKTIDHDGKRFLARKRAFPGFGVYLAVGDNSWFPTSRVCFETTVRGFRTGHSSSPKVNDGPLFKRI